MANRSESGRADRLFRAAVSAFCSLTRPTRREIVQLDRLAMPLYDRASQETRRYVAAALSDSSSAPKALLLRLGAEPVETAATVLMRSPQLSDVDLLHLISRCGLAHARVIVRRPRLNPAIAHLVRALEAASSRGGPAETTPVAEADPKREEPAPPTRADGPAAEAARQRLRLAMFGNDAGLPRPNDGGRTTGESDEIDHYRRLKVGILAGNWQLFQMALADAVDIDHRLARSIGKAQSYQDLIAALRALGLGEEQAFLLVCAADPRRFSRTEAVRAFLQAFRAIGPAHAAERMQRLRRDGESPVEDGGVRAS